MRHLSKLTVLFLGSAFIACADGPVPTEGGIPDPNLAVTSTGWFNVSFTQFDLCNAEFVDFTTRRKEIFIATADAGGGFHVGVHRTWIGKGVGQTTGTPYQLNWPNEIQQYFGGPFPETFSRHTDNNLVSQGAGDNRIFSLTQHVTVNANGDVTSDFRDQTLRCVGPGGTPFTATSFGWGLTDPDLGNCAESRTFAQFCADDKDVAVDANGTSHITSRTLVSPIFGDLVNGDPQAVVLVLSAEIDDGGDGTGDGTISIAATWQPFGLTGTFEGSFTATFAGDNVVMEFEARGTEGDFRGMRMAGTMEEMETSGSGGNTYEFVGEIF